MLQYIVRSLPRLVCPQHWFAGNGGLPRIAYFADVCLAHPRDLVPDVLALDFGLVDVEVLEVLDFVARFRGRFVAARDRVLLGIFLSTSPFAHITSTKKKSAPFSEPIPKRKIIIRVGPSGYVCMRGRVCVREAHAAISGASCDYDAMAAYVCRVVSTVLGRDATGAKFRVSDNDNTDAAAFHRDAIRAPGATPFELLTCIVYLDDAAMQLIRTCGPTARSRRSR